MNKVDVEITKTIQEILELLHNKNISKYDAQAIASAVKEIVDKTI